MKSHATTTLTLAESARDKVRVLVFYRPAQHAIQLMRWFKGISSGILLAENPGLRKQSWGRHFLARGYLAVSSRPITAEQILATVRIRLS